MSEAGRHFSYTLFGLRLHSEMCLPELFTGCWAVDPDVVIRRGRVEISDGHQGPLFGDGAFLLNVPDVARFRVHAGREIVVDAESRVPEGNVRLFLLGSAFGALLHQRGLLPLHANAVEIGGKAVVFMGESGAGKSTLAAWFHDHGYRLLADDVCVVDFAADGRALAMPGLPRLRLWQDALAARARSTETLQRSYVSGTDEKYDLPVDHDMTVREPIEIAAVFEMVRGRSSAIEPLRGIDATEAIYAHTYRGGFVELMQTSSSLWQSAVQLVGSVPISRLQRVWGMEALNQQFGDLIERVLPPILTQRGPLSSFQQPSA